MKLGIIGLPLSGRSTTFEALTRQGSETASHGEDRLAVVRVPDERVDRLSRMFEPQKTIYAQVDYFLAGQGSQKKEANPWLPVKDCDALIHVVRNHGPDPTPAADFRAVEQELILSDLVQVEKRLERIELDHRRGRKTATEEQPLLAECRRLLESETPLRRSPELCAAKPLRGFALLTAKPVLVLFNNEDGDPALPDIREIAEREKCLVLRGKLEQELSRMSEEDAAEFLKEYQIGTSAMGRMIQQSYEVMGLVAFFTVGSDEVRAWTIRRGTPAVEAAGVIHSDIQKGFIRAEVISYEDLMAAGSTAEARRRGTFRLEGKAYEVKDGDIINFRFNV
ncbi:MAG: YchF family ATPase [Desulfobacterales bacterium]|jgi:GTP-binding protein YchF|nr:YchF family ATPase [Desulfobacterales bacterium]